MTRLIHNKTKEEVQGNQYIQGEHPPPRGVTVTMGLSGVLAKVTTIDGPRNLNHTDWVLKLPGVGIDIFTDSFVRKMYTVVESLNDSEPDKPLRLG